MALKGTLNSTPPYESRYLQFSWTATQSVSGNYSNVSWTLTGAGGNSAYWYMAGNFKVVIDGDVVYQTSQDDRIYLYGGTTVASGTKKISHNADGTRSFSVSIQGGIYTYAVNTSASTSFTLDTIDRYPTTPKVTSPTAGIIDEKTTSITVKWNASDKGKYTLEVSKNSGIYSVIAENIATNTLTYTYSITPKQGDIYKFRVKSIYNGLSSSYSNSGTVTLNSLTAPVIGTLTTAFNPYVNETFTVPLSGGSQANGNGFKRKADVYMKNTSDATVKWYGNYSSISNGNTSVDVTVTKSKVIEALGTGRYSADITVIAWIENANGSRSSYVYKTTTVNINTDGGATPTLGNISLSGGYTGYTSTCFIAGMHNIVVTSAAATARRAVSGVSMTYTISCTGFSNVSGTTATFNNPKAGLKTIKVTAKDSRGLSASKTIYCRVQSWTAPTVTIKSAVRDATDPSIIKVTYSVKYSPIYNTYGSDGNTAGTDINGISKQQYAKNEVYDNCTSPITITGTNTEIGYTIIVRAADKIDQTAWGSSSRYVGTMSMDISIRKHNVGIGCIPDESYRLDVKGITRIYDDSGAVEIGSGSVHVDGFINVGGNIYLQNSKYVYWYRADGTTPQGVLTLNSDNNFAINYGGYSAEIGSTNVYGNYVKLLSKNAITTNNSLEVNGNGSCIGTARFNASWVGMYPSHSEATGGTNRKWWIGHNNTDNLYIANETGNKYVMFESNFVLPKGNNSTYLGGSSYRWHTVFSVNALNTSSDRYYKKNILELDDRYEDLFNKLKPVTFERTFANSDRTHIGFISQDIEESMNDVGLTAMDFAGFCKDIKTTNNNGEEIKVLNEDGNYEYEYSLRYEEFIALNTHMIQKLQKEIEELKQMVKEGK